MNGYCVLRRVHSKINNSLLCILLFATSFCLPRIAALFALLNLFIYSCIFHVRCIYIHDFPHPAYKIICMSLQVFFYFYFQLKPQSYRGIPQINFYITMEIVVNTFFSISLHVSFTLTKSL